MVIVELPNVAGRSLPDAIVCEAVEMEMGLGQLCDGCKCSEEQ